MEQGFHAGQLEVVNPVAPLANEKKRLSKIIIMISVGGLLTSFLTFGLAGAGLYQVGRGGAATLTVLGALAAAFVALGLWLPGRRDSRQVFVPAGAPPGFTYGSEPHEGLERRFLPSYAIPDGLLRRLQRRWGASALFARPEQLKVAQRGLDGVTWLVASAILMFAITMLAFVDPAPAAMLFGLMVGLAAVGGIIWAATIKFGLIRKMIMQQNPRCEPEERISTVHGGGDPFLLSADLDQRLMDIRYNRIPNRIGQVGWDGAARHVSETGRFEAAFFLETQPAYVNRATPEAALELAKKAVPLWLVGAAFLSVAVPGVGFFATLIQMIGGVAFLLIAHSLFTDADILLRRFRWHSTGLLLKAEGSTGKAEILAGRGRNDSFESKNTVVRSDCKFRWYAGNFVSESTEVMGPRSLLAIQPDVVSHRALEIVDAALDAFRNKGVRIREIELADGSAGNMLKANVVAFGAMNTPPLAGWAPVPIPNSVAPAALPPSEGSQGAGLAFAPDPPVNGSGQPKVNAAKPPTRGEAAPRFCHSCGSKISQAKASFCGGCGTRL